MKKIILFFYILMQLNLLLAQDNKIQNGDFEKGGCYPENCESYDVFKDVDDWKSECSNYGKYKKGEWGIKRWQSVGKFPNQRPRCPARNWHSPDHGCADSDEGYVGLGRWELIQQKMSNSNKLEENKHYLLTFKFRLPNYTWNRVLTETDFLKLYLTRRRVHYKKRGRIATFQCQGWDCTFDVVPDGYSEYEDGIYQDFIELEEISIMNYELDEWHEVRLFFNGPPNGIDDYNWFVFDVHSNANEAYVHVDNISIVEVDYCNPDPCSATDGDVFPSNPYLNNNYVSVSGLENVASAQNIVISDVAGNEMGRLPDVYSINGIYNPIMWGVIPIDQGHYVWEMDLHNDCGKTEYKIYFPIGATLVIPPEQTSYNNDIQTPLPCCDNEPDIFLQNKTLYGTGELKYIAQNNIYVNDVIIENELDLVVFQAGNEIIFEGEFESNGNFEAYIEECTPNNNAVEKSLETDIDSSKTEPFDIVENENIKTKETILNNDINNKINIEISPNPSNGLFLITISPANVDIQEVMIYNNFGNLIYRNKEINSKKFQIDLTSEYPGIYFISFITIESIYTQKLIFNE